MANNIRLTASVATVNISTPVALNKTHLLGGQGKEGYLRIASALPITSTVLVQGAPTALATHAVPASNSTDWTTLLTLTSASPTQQIINDLPEWIRLNTTVLDADGPDLEIFLSTTP